MMEMVMVVWITTKTIVKRSSKSVSNMVWLFHKSIKIEHNIIINYHVANCAKFTFTFLIIRCTTNATNI